MDISISIFEDHSGDRVPEACEVFPNHGLDAGGPAQESFDSETIDGSLSPEETHR